MVSFWMFVAVQNYKMILGFINIQLDKIQDFFPPSVLENFELKC